MVEGVAPLAAGPGPLAVPAGARVEGRLRLPPSKSLTQRYLNLALLARASVEIESPLLADDTRHFLTALERLGWGVVLGTQAARLTPGPPPAVAELDCGDGGTMLRFLLATLTTVPGRWQLDGSARLRERPVAPLVAALRGLGARVRCLEQEGFAPLEIEGGTLAGGRIELDAARSSQYASALLMAATRATSEVELHVAALTSRPYLELTLQTLSEFGGEVGREGSDHFRVRPRPLAGGRYRVEGDLSAAAYPAAAAVLTGGRVLLEGAGSGSVQGDRRFFEVLARMGGEVAWRPDGVEVRGTGRLQAVDEDLSDLPDQVPTLAALASFARGTTRIRNVPHLRLKESDRLAAMARELTRLGATVRERRDGLEIDGTWAAGPPPAAEVVVDSWGDHRIAMSLALVGLRRPGVAISRPQVVSKSYPDFWRDLERLTGRPLEEKQGARGG